MAAAPRVTFEAAKPVLDALGDKVFHVGERPGQGATVKTINQLLCGCHIAVAAEAFGLAADTMVHCLRATLLSREQPAGHATFYFPPGIGTQMSVSA